MPFRIPLPARRGRHGSRRRRHRRVRTGLLTPSALMAVTVVAFFSGPVLPSSAGPGGFVSGDGPDRRLQTGGGDDATQRQGTAAVPPADRAPAPAPAPAPTAAPSTGATAVRATDLGATGVGALAPTAAATEVLDLVNQECARTGCKALADDRKLGALASDFSKDMAARDFFAHTDPDGDDPWERAEEAGVTNLGGENIARGPAAPRTRSRWWTPG